MGPRYIQKTVKIWRFGLVGRFWEIFCKVRWPLYDWEITVVSLIDGYLVAGLFMRKECSCDCNCKWVSHWASDVLEYKAPSEREQKCVVWDDYIRWIWDDYIMTMRCLWNYCEMTVIWLLDDCEMTLRWLWDDSEMTVRWLWVNCMIAVLKIKICSYDFIKS